MQWGAKNGTSSVVTESAIMDRHQCIQNEVNACRCVQRGPLLQASRIAPTLHKTAFRRAWGARAFANSTQGSKSIIRAAAEPEGVTLSLLIPIAPCTATVWVLYLMGQ